MYIHICICGYVLIHTYYVCMYIMYVHVYVYMCMQHFFLFFDINKEEFGLFKVYEDLNARKPCLTNKSVSDAFLFISYPLRFIQVIIPTTG